MKTFMASPATIDRKWYVVDAEGKTLGRLASIICGAMMFKSHTCFERATEYIIDNEKKLRNAVPTKDLKLKTGDKK